MADRFPDLTPLLNPKRIALIGASERHGSAGRLVLENLQKLNYPGEIYPVNPKCSQVLGLPCYPSLDALPKPVDMAAILLGADKVLPTLEDMARLGIPAAWALASGFSETGPEGKKLQAEVVRFCREKGILLCGPNCIGAANLSDRSATYSVAIKPGLRVGGVSAVMQSGAILMGLANSARFGFRYLISSGNEAVLDSADYIAYLAGDPQTRVILAFLEGIRDAEKFIRAARAASAAGKPILVLKVGRSDAAQRAVQAHTGSLAGSDAVLDAVFEREGIQRFDSLDELVEAAELFSACSLPQGDGIGMISLSGGQIGLISDLAQNKGLKFPSLAEETIASLGEVLPPYTNLSNPLDAWGSGDLENLYPRCVDILAKDPDIQLIAMSRDTPPGVAQREVEQSLQVAKAAIRAREESGKPVLIFSNFSAGFEPQVEALLRNKQIPYLQGTPETLTALYAFEKFAAYRREAREKLPAVRPADLPSAEEVAGWRERLKGKTDSSLNEIESRELLAAYGIRGPREKTAGDAAAAVQAAAEIGYPVVMKILSPDIQHKTEAGGVRIGIAATADAEKAFTEMKASALRYKPSARIDGVIVQEMIPNDAVEIILGLMKDATFGPILVFGIGGVLVELVKDSTLCLPPISMPEAHAVIDRIRSKKLLDGFRGRPAVDREALADALVRFSYLAVDLGDLISAVDVNPLMALPTGRGVCAVDALVELNHKDQK